MVGLLLYRQDDSAFIQTSSPEFGPGEGLDDSQIHSRPILAIKTRPLPLRVSQYVGLWSVPLFRLWFSFRIGRVKR